MKFIGPTVQDRTRLDWTGRDWTRIAIDDSGLNISIKLIGD